MITSITFRIRSEERGFSLVTALAVAFTLLLLISLLMSYAIHAGQHTALDRTRTQAFHVAEAGLNDALSKLATDPNYGGASTPQAVAAKGTDLGAFTTTVSLVDGSPDQRLVRSVGVAADGQQRVIEESVRLVPLGSFDYALFSASSMSLTQHLNVNGDAYATGQITLDNQTNFVGTLVSPGNITTGNNSSITGLVWSGGNVVIANGTTVNGNVIATGSVTVYGTVTGDVRAASITVTGGTIGGQAIGGVNNPAPPAQTLPTFTYDAANYTPPPTSFTSVPAFNSYWSTNRTAMSGTYYVTDSTGGTITGPNQRTTLTGDLTIITDRPISVPREFESSDGGVRRLVIISTFPCCDPEAVSWTNNITLPTNIEVFIYTTGKAEFSNQKNFHGIVYGQQVETDQYMTVTYEPDVLKFLVGFGWDLSSAGQYNLEPGVWHECNDPEGACV